MKNLTVLVRNSVAAAIALTTAAFTTTVNAQSVVITVPDQLPVVFRIPDYQVTNPTAIFVCGTGVNPCNTTQAAFNDILILTPESATSNTIGRFIAANSNPTNTINLNQLRGDFTQSLSTVSDSNKLFQGNSTSSFSAFPVTFSGGSPSSRQLIWTFNDEPALNYATFNFSDSITGRLVDPDPISVPEPSAIAPLSTAILGFIFYGWRRRRQNLELR